MIPFFQFTTIHLFGPISIQAWGFLVALGILAGIGVGHRLAKKHSLSTILIFDATVWALLAGILGARLIHVLFYDIQYYLANPVDIIKFWQGGASSLGGFVGAAVGVFLFLLKRKITWGNFLPYLDVGILSLWLGWGIGRIGCFLIHDHPGTLSHFLLAVKFPGGARHDLGLYDSLVGFGLFSIFFILSYKKILKVGSGAIAGYSFMIYAIARFFLDFLRATDLPNSDVRYWSLTPAQWGMLIVIIVLIIGQIHARMRKIKSI